MDFDALALRHLRSRQLHSHYCSRQRVHTRPPTAIDRLPLIGLPSPSRASPRLPTVAAIPAAENVRKRCRVRRPLPDLRAIRGSREVCSLMRGHHRWTAHPLPGGTVLVEGRLVAQHHPPGDTEGTRRLAPMDRRCRRRSSRRACLPSPARQLRPHPMTSRRQQHQADLATGRPARRVVLDRRGPSRPPKRNLIGTLRPLRTRKAHGIGAFNQWAILVRFAGHACKSAPF